MTQLEFDQHRQTWLDEWHDQWRLLDIDFETYMIMNGMSAEDFKAINEVGWNQYGDDAWGETFI